MGKLKNGKAANGDEINGEMIKGGSDRMPDWKCNMAFESSAVPEDWSSAIIV